MMSETTPSARVRHWLAETERHPDSAVAHFNLGLAYTCQGHVNSAEAAYRRALELDPSLVEAWVNLGGVLLLKWDFRGAVEAIERALALRDDLVIAHYNRGQAYLYLGDAERVVESNRRVVELAPDHAAGRYFLAVGLLACGRVEEARRELSQAMALGHRPAPEFLQALERAERQARPVGLMDLSPRNDSGDESR
ncbi:MAG: tetratricopeptide repeat protein [Acidobacteria bacterium]|nr:MAG: tetratricopeptide repeat protein [Acidobacteriota bacterium]